MVKDEMVKQGKSRGTGRPGKVTWIVETERVFFVTASKAPSHQLGPILVGLYYHVDSFAYESLLTLFLISLDDH